MYNIKANVTCTDITLEITGPLTRGMAGALVFFTFDASWEGLKKTAVFRVGSKTIDVVDIQDQAVIPWELLEVEYRNLFVGVYGANEDGKIILPTIWGDAGMVLPAADPSGDESTAPTLPVWQQMQNQIDDQAKKIGDVDAALDAILAIQNSLLGGDGQ